MVRYRRQDSRTYGLGTHAQRVEHGTLGISVIGQLVREKAATKTYAVFAKSIVDSSGHAIEAQKGVRHSCQILNTQRAERQYGHQFFNGRPGSAHPQKEIRYQTLEGRRQLSWFTHD